jgi:hypothetical protein
MAMLAFDLPAVTYPSEEGVPRESMWLGILVVQPSCKRDIPKHV